MTKDYYQTLNVPKGASDEEIKRSYRSLAMKHHPDRGGDANAFQEIQEAYGVLSDPQKRAEYDNPQPQGFSFQQGGVPPGFEHFFGGGHPFADIFGFGRPRQPTNRTIQMRTTITLEEAFYGKELMASVVLPSGREQTFTMNIPAGVHEGTTLKLTGMGDDSLPGVPRGDLLLQVSIVDHPHFKRQGDDLLRDCDISCIDAMAGVKITITTIDGKQLETTIPSGTQHDTILSLNGFGMPNINDPSRRGRLLLKIKLIVPVLSEAQKLALRNLNI